MKYSQATRVLLGAIKRADLSVVSLSKAIGIPYKTLYRRLSDPGSWRLCELRAVLKRIDLLPNEESILRKEVGFD